MFQKNNLVYFDFDNSSATNIEHVSLSSFDKTLVVKMITEDVNDQSDIIMENNWWYYNNTHFKYNNLWLLFCSFESEPNSPKNVEEWFELCRKELYMFYSNDELLDIVDILDLNLWVEKNYDIRNCFGKNIEEAIFLYNVFVEKKYISKNGEWKCKIESNKVLSPIWNDIINHLSIDDLKTLVNAAPLLQPLLPEDFCKGNLQLLSLDYRMPNETICRLVCENRINNIREIDEYECLNKLLTRYKCNDAYDTKETGFSMEAMSKKTFAILKKKLDRQFNKFIKPYVIEYYCKLSGKYSIKNDLALETVTNDELLLLGKIIIKDNVLTSETPFRYTYIQKTLEIFNGFNEDRRNIIKPFLKAQVNDLLLRYSAIEAPSASCISVWLDCWHGWISEPIFEQIKANVNASFSLLDDLEQLKEAYSAALITEGQYLSRYKELTSQFDVRQIESQINSGSIFGKTDYPLSVQKYLVVKFISFFDYNSLDSYRPIRYGDMYSQCICNIRELLKWIEEVGRGNFDNSICDEAKLLIIDKLTSDDKFVLLEEKLISNLDADLLIENRRDKYCGLF